MANTLKPPWLLNRLNHVRWYGRWPIKWALFGVAYLAVCFPYPHLAVRHVSRWTNPQKLVEPEAAALQPLARKLHELIEPEMAPAEVLRTVEGFVYRHLPYDWDWNTWGMADYIPTVEEALAKGREDCDGRAVVAASLLQKLGYDARIVTDFGHVWVDSSLGQTMGPGKIKTVEITDEGMKINANGFWQLPRILSYGIAVFPLKRELILVMVFWLLLIGRVSLGRSLAALTIFIVGLLLLRWLAADYWAVRPPYELGCLLLLLVGVGLLVFRRGPALPGWKTGPKPFLKSTPV